MIFSQQACACSFTLRLTARENGRMNETINDERRVIPLARGLAIAGLRYGAGRDKILAGEIWGEQRDGRWYVDADEMARLRRERDRAVPTT